VALKKCFEKLIAHKRKLLASCQCKLRNPRAIQYPEAQPVLRLFGPPTVNINALLKLLSVTRSFRQTARSRLSAKWGGGDEFRDIDWSNEWKLGKEGSGSYRPDMVVIAGFVDSAQVFIFTKKANTAR
jgi:hypothetical protein